MELPTTVAGCKLPAPIGAGPSTAVEGQQPGAGGGGGSFVRTYMDSIFYFSMQAQTQR